jgi:hypothetical protein
MRKSSSQNISNLALRTAAATRAHEARRVLQAAKESLDKVAKATNVQLITSDSNRTPTGRNSDS